MKNAEMESEILPFLMHYEKNRFLIVITLTISWLLLVLKFGRSWRKCATIQMSVQAFRIHGNVADFDVNPGPKAFWSSLVLKAFHRLSF